MQNNKSKKNLAKFKRALAEQLKADITATVRGNTQIPTPRTDEAIEALTTDPTVLTLIRDLANEEVEATVSRGELPKAAILHLAGYRQNSSAEG